MSPLAILILALSMSADAFAAAVGRGAAHSPSPRQALKAGLVFGLIEGATPFVGWGLGMAASGFVQKIDHWIAFVLLLAVGGRMAWEATRRRAQGEGARPPKKGAGALVVTAIGTSIDAAAVGVSLAMIRAPMLVIGASIGFSTFCLASLGMMIGSAAGRRLGSWAELIGGLALVGLGGFILFEHLSGRA